MKFSVILAMVMMVSGCGQKTTEISGKYILPAGLQGCKLFALENGMSYMRVMRCPASATTVTYTAGKTTVTNVVIEGVEYAPVNN
jgi:hypothetical protein